MTRRTILTGAAAGSLAALPAAQLGRAPAPRNRKPNVIVILMDDLGCRDLGVYGAADLKTPNIDSIARSGARFENWYSNAPVCAPARAALMTGRFPMRAGIPDNGLDRPTPDKMIP